GMCRCKCREAAQRANAVAAYHVVEPRLILRKAAAVALAMPEMEHAGREAPVLAPHPGVDQPDCKVGILKAPAIEARIKAVDTIEVTPRVAKIACARPLPAPRPGFAQPAER